MRITTVQDLKDRKEQVRIQKVTLIITGYPTSIAKRAASSSSFTSPVVITIIIIIIIILLLLLSLTILTILILLYAILHSIHLLVLLKQSCCCHCIIQRNTVQNRTELNRVIRHSATKYSQVQNMMVHLSTEH